MVIQRSSAAQTSRLIEDLIGADPVRREAASARLAIVGERAVDRLLASLTDAAPDAAAAILRTLEAIGSARVVPAAVARLEDATDAVAIAAAGALRPHLRAPDDDVAGKTLEGLTALALATGRTDATRIAALEALGEMGPETLEPIRARLRNDASPAVRHMAGWGEAGLREARAADGPDATLTGGTHADGAGDGTTGAGRSDVGRRGAGRLGAGRTDVRGTGVGRTDIGRAGAGLVGAGRVDVDRAGAGQAGAGRAGGGADVGRTGAGRADAPLSENAATRLEVAARGELPEDADTVRALLVRAGGAVALSVLHDLVLALREKERGTEDAAAALDWMTARGAVHQALAERHSRLAIFDLRETFESASARLPLGFVAAITDGGDTSCLPALATAWQQLDDRWMRDHLAAAFRAIMAREGLTRRHAAVKRALERAPDGLGSLIKPASTARR